MQNVRHLAKHVGIGLVCFSVFLFTVWQHGQIRALQKFQADQNQYDETMKIMNLRMFMLFQSEIEGLQDQVDMLKQECVMRPGDKAL